MTTGRLGCREVGDDPGDRRDGGSLLSRALAAAAFGSVRSRHNRGGVLAGHRVTARHIGRLCLGCGFLLWGCSRPVPTVELVGFAVLPADYFVPGPTSGQFIAAANGRAPPFENRQPVQGFSALIKGEDGAFLALPDNGFGSKQNSPDFLLRVYELRPDFVTPAGGSGRIDVRSLFVLRDPDHHIVFPIIADLGFYPGSDIPVDPSIRDGRLLTGADFDVESFRRVPDGTFYFGDEFGPFLLHTDASGRLLQPPISLPGVRSPQHPQLGDELPNLPRSGGFEGMALSADGTMLFPMLELPLAGQQSTLNVYAFQLSTRTYSHVVADSAAYCYPLSLEGNAVPELTVWSGDDYLVIERDGGQGPAAEFKRIFLINRHHVDSNGLLVKTEIADLLAIPDPHNLGGSGTGTFSFPFETTEALVVSDDSTIGLINDNNYPFGLGRHIELGEPDDSEFILVWVRRRPAS
jgi:hypothetical protein